MAGIKITAVYYAIRRSAIMSMAIFSLYGSPVLAQDTLKTAAKWNLQKCLDYARANNIQVNRLRLTAASGKQDALLARSAVLPDLYGTATQSLTNGNAFNSGTGQLQSGVNPSGSYGVSSSWTLYQGGYLRYDIQQRNLSAASANLDVLQQENDITLQITQYYLNILLDKESIIYVQDLAATSRLQLGLARRRFAAGSIARRDVVQLEAQLADDQYTLTVSQNAERQDLLTLKQALQLPSETPFDIERPGTAAVQKIFAALSAVQYRG